MQKSQSLAVEDVEPFIPGNGFKGALAAEAGEIDAQHAAAILATSGGAGHLGRVSAARFDPTLDFFVVSAAPTGARPGSGPAGSGLSAPFGGGPGRSPALITCALGGCSSIPHRGSP